MEFLENALELDACLVSEHPEIVRLGDRLFPEIIEINPSLVNTKRKQYRAKETLKVILINLIVAYREGRSVRYYRRSSAYSKNQRYRKIWFNKERTLGIVDALNSLGYIETKDAVYDQKNGEDFRRMSRMWTSEKLIQLLDPDLVFKIGIKREPPATDDLIQVRNNLGELVPITGDLISSNQLDRMTTNLKRYNKFTAKQDVEVRLSEADKVNEYFFLKIRSNINHQNILITKFNSDWDGEINPVEYQFDRNDSDDAEETDGITLTDDELNQIRYCWEYLTCHLSRAYRSLTDNPYSNIFSKHTEQTHSTNLHTRNRIAHTVTSMTGIRINNNEQNQSINFIENDHLDNKKMTDLKSIGIKNLWFKSQYQFLHRVFNQNMKQGGRFYGGLHIGFPKEVRKQIFINSSPTLELDFSGHHIRILYHKYLRRNYQGDPYGQLCGNPDQRKIFKRILLVAINCPAQKNLIKAICHKLREDGYSMPITSHNFIENSLERVGHVHPDLMGFLGSGKGIELQCLEGKIVDIVLTRLMAKGVPCLPVHDSFIVPVEAKDLLLENMVYAYKQVVGKKYDPVIK